MKELSEKMMQKISAKFFEKVLRNFPEPGGNIKLFLKAHWESVDRKSTFTRLAAAARYKYIGGINFQYGTLGSNIAKELNVSVPSSYAKVMLLGNFYRQDSSTH